MKKKSNGQGSYESRKVKDYRFFVVAAVFLLLCAVFIAVMAATLSKGPSKIYETLDVRSETVVGERGRIFDRNGNLLAGNLTSYSFVFEYGSMGYSADEVSRALLECIDALNDSGNSTARAKDYFALKGKYPDMSFADEISDKDSNEYYYFNRFLVKNELKEDLSAKELVKFFTDKYKLTEKKYTAEEITELIRVYYDMNRIGFGAYQPYTIAKGLLIEDAKTMSLISRIKENRVEGASFIKQTERVYYYGGYASHILGKLGKITAENVQNYPDYPLDATVGISGCELAFEQYLKGTKGKLISKYDINGKLVEEYYDPAPSAGNDIYLTIDIELQMAAEDAMKAEIERLTDADAGAVTAVDPSTGEVLVIASYPTYEVSQFNRALQGLYAPGSTYKIGSALAALEEGHITSSTTYDCNQTCSFGPSCLGHHDNVNVHGAIEVSCNVFFDYVGFEMGLDRITKYTKKLGLGVATGIELGEKTGVIATEDMEGWETFDNAAGAIGQSKHAYTPMQLSVYMSTVVNHGTRYSAHLLKEVKSRGGKVIESGRTEIAETLEFSESTYGTLMESMRSVVTSNAALTRHFSGVNATVGGKTGTAEKAGQTDNALFSGFAPAEKPQIVASCIIEKGEAGTNAAKIVAAIFEEYFSEKNDD